MCNIANRHFSAPAAQQGAVLLSLPSWAHVWNSTAMLLGQLEWHLRLESSRSHWEGKPLLAFSAGVQREERWIKVSNERARLDESDGLLLVVTGHPHQQLASPNYLYNYARK